MAGAGVTEAKQRAAVVERPIYQSDGTRSLLVAGKATNVPNHTGTKPPRKHTGHVYTHRIRSTTEPETDNLADLGKLTCHVWSQLNSMRRCPPPQPVFSCCLSEGTTSNFQTLYNAFSPLVQLESCRHITKFISLFPHSPRSTSAWERPCCFRCC